MRRAVVLAVLVFLLLAASAAAGGGARTTTLLTASGQPVGGQWQAWLDQSLVPTYAGAMTLDVGTTGLCGVVGYATLGCTSDHGFTPDVAGSQIPETAIDLAALPSYSYLFTPAQTEQWVLLYEQGHVVDFAYLNDGERAQLLGDWGVTVPAGESISQFWWQNVGDEASGQPVMGEWFAAAYSICALYGRGLTWQQVQYVGGNLIPTMSSTLVSGLPILQAASDPGAETAADAKALHVQLATCALIGTLGPGEPRASTNAPAVHVTHRATHRRHRRHRNHRRCRRCRGASRGTSRRR